MPPEHSVTLSLPPDLENPIRMLSKSICALMLSFTMASLSGAVQAEGGSPGNPAGNKQSDAALDRSFESEVYRLLEQQAGSAARYVQVTRFGNTIVITGEVEKSADAKKIDGLVLKAAGIKRETPAGSKVVAEKNRGCGGKPATGNAKRKLIVTGKKDCSSLRSDESAQASGSFYNHLAVGAPDAPNKVATTNLLLAETVVELVDAGHAEVLDRAVMRMVAQDGMLYIIGSQEDTERTRIKAMLMALPDVVDVVFYTE